MITPTGTTVADYTDALMSGAEQYARLRFIARDVNGTETVVNITKDDIQSSGINLHDILNGDTNLAFGKAVMKELTISILGSSGNVGSIKWTDEFALEMGVDIDGTTEYVTVGYFTGSRPEKIQYVDVIQFTAYDRMMRFEIDADPFLETVTFPITIWQLLQDICDYRGVTIDDTGDALTAIMGRSITNNTLSGKGLSLRDIIALIAEAAGCYARITAEGKMELRWFTNADISIDADHELGISSADIETALTWGNLADRTWANVDGYRWSTYGGYFAAYKVDGMSVKDVENDVGVQYGSTDGNQYVILDNPFLVTANQTEADTYIKPIYDRICAFGGNLPISVQCVGNWLVESGDIITVDVHGTSMILPIYTKTMSWNGACTDSYEITGSTSRPSVTRGTRQKLIENGRFHKIIVDIEQLFSEIQNANGDISTLQQLAEQIVLSVADKYGIVSGIDITADGIKISGQKYIQLSSDGVLDIQTPDFVLDSQTKYIYINASNFLLDSENKKLTTGQWQFHNGGVTWSDGTYDFNISKPSDTNGIIFHCDMPNAPTGRYFYLSPSGHLIPTHTSSANRNGDIGSSSSRWENGYFVSLNTNGLVNNSSRKVKHGIKLLPSFGEKLDKLQPVSFIYNNDEEERTKFGLIFEDAVDVIPEICEGDADIDPENAGIDYVKLVPLLLKEIQDLRKRVADLEHMVK